MGARQMTQSDLAAAIKRSQNYVSERLRDEKPFTIDDLDGILRVFGVTAVRFMERAVTHEPMFSRLPNQTRRNDDDEDD